LIQRLKKLKNLNIQTLKILKREQKNSRLLKRNNTKTIL